jgi:lysyl-tRNA synthetase class 1
MYQSPRRAKRLFFDVIPNAMDEYIEAIDRFKNGDVDNAVFHIHNGNPPKYKNCLRFSMLLNLVQACSTDDEDILFNFIQKYAEKYNYSTKTIEFLKKLAKYAVVYYRDFISHSRTYTIPNESQKKAINSLAEDLEKIHEDSSADEIQTIIFEVGKRFYDQKDLKKWFETLYGVLFGTKSGPKMGSFVSLYGVKNTVQMIRAKCI